MAAKVTLHGYLRSKKGDSAVEFIMTAALLVLTFAMLISALIYVTQYYNSSYICRRVVRTIETTGKYDEATVLALADDLGSNALNNLNFQVDATYFSEHRIQLRDKFSVTLTAEYRINILQFGQKSFYANLPIKIRLSGRSEVYWK